MSIKQANIPYCNLRQSADRTGISAARAYHTDLRGMNLRESARAAGDMFGGGSWAGRINVFQFLFYQFDRHIFIIAKAVRIQFQIIPILKIFHSP